MSCDVFKAVSGINGNMINSNDLELLSTEQIQMAEDMKDVIMLFCVRKEIKYASYLCDILSPLMLATKNITKSLASSCFYALNTQFLPLVSLPVSNI